MLGQPGQGHATYIYAHAREGMFLPLLNASKIQNGKKMLGMIVEVWTSDDQRFLYEITEVRRPPDQTSTTPLNAKSEELWLQTSEGPAGTAGKLQIVADAALPGGRGPRSRAPEAAPGRLRLARPLAGA